MSDVALNRYDANHRWRFDLVLPILVRPSRAFAGAVVGNGAAWQTPIVVLLVTGVIRTLVASSIQQAASLAAGPGALPPGFEYYTPEQQAQLQQAMAATSGPVFVYLLPALMTLLGVYLGWLLLGWIVHLGLTIVGGRGRSEQTLKIVAWSLLPFAVRDVVRIAAMWIAGQPLTTLGLSGFAPAESGDLSIFLAALLAMIDFYLFWHIFLLFVGVRAAENFSRSKSWALALTIIVSLTLLRALPALIAAQFSDITVIRPFI